MFCKGPGAGTSAERIQRGQHDRCVVGERRVVEGGPTGAWAVMSTAAQPPTANPEHRVTASGRARETRGATWDYHAAGQAKGLQQPTTT